MHLRYRIGRTSFIALSLIATVLAAGCSTPPNSVLRLRAQESMERGDFDEAEAPLTLAVKQHPGDWKALYYLGLVRLNQNRPLDARLRLEAAYALRDEHSETPDILDALAEAYLREPNEDKLFNLLNDAVARYGTTRDFLRQGEFLARAGDVDGARVAYEKALKFAREDDIRPWLATADFYEGLGDRATAIQALRRAAAIEPENKSIQRRIESLSMGPGPAIGANPPR